MPKSSLPVQTLHALVALAVGFAGGALFYLLHTPLPWTLGSLFATALMAFAGGKWFLPRLAWNFARPFVGVLAGSAFTLPVVLSIAGWWDVILALTVYSVMVTLLGWIYFHRVCKYDDVTSFFASAPGGLGELSLLGSTLGGNIRTLVLVHAVRVMVVVFTVPFLVRYVLLPEIPLSGLPPAHVAAVLSPTDWLVMTACGVIGFFIGRPFSTFGGVMLAPLLLSAGVHIAGLTEVSPPTWLVAFVQILIGAISGSRFAGTEWRELRTIVLHALVWALFLVATALFAAWLCTFFADEPLIALVLAFAPGGIVEVTVIAYAIGLHVAFIVTCQITRVTFVLLLTPTLFRATPRTGSKFPDD